RGRWCVGVGCVWVGVGGGRGGGGRGGRRPGGRAGRAGGRRRGRRAGRGGQRRGRGDCIEAAEAARLVEAGCTDVDGAPRERGLYLRGRQRRGLVEKQRGHARPGP